MTEQTKFLIAGIFFLLLLVATLALMKTEKADSVASVPSGAGNEVADRLKDDAVGGLKKEPAEAPTRSQRDSASRKSSAGSGVVPQAQIDLVRKREEARIRRDEMLKVRAQTIKDLGPGNTGEPQR